MLDDATRTFLEREIDRAQHPSGMSVHDGRVHIDASVIQRLLAIIEKLTAERNAMRETMTPNDINLAAGSELARLLDHIYEHSTASEGVMPLAVTFARAIEAEVLRRVMEANK